MARKACPRGTKLQTVILSKSKFSEKSAREWLKWYGMSTGLDVKPNSLRARQRSPKSFVKGSFRTVQFAPGVKGVVGCPKK